MIHPSALVTGIVDGSIAAKAPYDRVLWQTSACHALPFPADYSSDKLNIVWI